MNKSLFIKKSVINTVFGLFLCFLIIIIFAPALFSQSIKFCYDQSGNRISRQLSIINNVALPNQRKITSIGKSGIDMSNESIFVGPNPTSGAIKVVIDGFSNQIKGEIYVYNMSGQIVFNTKVVQDITKFSIENKPNGIYLISVITDNNYVSYKIVKQ